MAPPDVHLVLSGFLIDGVVKVNRVGVLQPVVPAQQHATNSHQANKSCHQKKRCRRLFLLFLIFGENAIFAEAAEATYPEVGQRRELLGWWRQSLARLQEAHVGHLKEKLTVNHTRNLTCIILLRATHNTLNYCSTLSLCSITDLCHYYHFSLMPRGMCFLVR